MENHRNERRVRTLESEISTVSIEEETAAENDEVELKIEEENEDEDEQPQLEAEMGQKEPKEEEVESNESQQEEFPDTTLAMNFLAAGGLEFKAEELQQTHQVPLGMG